MAIIPLGADAFENLTLVTHPARTFISGTDGVVSGSVNVFPRVSKVEKDPTGLSPFNATQFDAQSLESFREEWVKTSQGVVPAGTTTIVTASNIEFFANRYLELVTSQSVSNMKSKTVGVTRFEPSFQLTSDTLRKNVLREVVFPYYRVRYPSLQWAVTNYHTLNFFTGSGIPNDSAFIYPAPSSSLTGKTQYRPETAFTYDFYLNPRYTTEGADGNYHAGTIFHMSSSIAISVVTGSTLNAEGKPYDFRLLLQLSHSADISPSKINLLKIDDGTYKNPGAADLRGGKNYNDLAFLSTKGSLQLNKWHHIAVRWGGNTVQDGTGSFIIDGDVDSTFVVPSASIIPQSFGDPQGDPDALFIGNFYEGRNNVVPGARGVNLIAQFFNSNAATNEGVTDFNNGAFSLDPPFFKFRHPLNAEVHELKIYNSYRDISQIRAAASNGPSLESELLFYVPPFFVKETRKRDILQTPFQDLKATTDDPFNVALSFGVGGHLLNLENFSREFVKKEYPRLFMLTGSTIDSSTGWATCNQYLFGTGSVRKRNLSVLPSDNGKFRPNFLLLSSGTLISHPPENSPLFKYTNDFGTLDLSLISLTDMVPTASLFPGLIAPDAGLPGTTNTSPNTIIGSIAGASPESVNDPGVAPGAVLTIFQRTRDASSNEVVFFDSSNLLYGNQIKEGSYMLQDPAVTGSGGRVKVTLKDNGMGSLYRSDASGSGPTWASAGNMLYEEGIGIVLSPVIPYFGKDKFKTEFNGTQNIHVLEIQVPCPAGQINSSSNPAFKSLKASNYASDVNSDFVYITGLNFHDDNLNIIARTNLTQPLLKRDEDKFVFKIKMDF